MELKTQAVYKQGGISKVELVGLIMEGPKSQFKCEHCFSVGVDRWEFSNSPLSTWAADPAMNEEERTDTSTSPFSLLGHRSPYPHYE